MDCPAFHIHDPLPATIAAELERPALPPRSGTVRLVTGADSDIHRRDIDRRGRKEATMVDPARRARLLRDLEQDFLPDYDAQSMPSADKRAAYALEHIAFRVGRIEQTLAKIATALETVLAKL
jgi:hypothetical protein